MLTGARPALSGNDLEAAWRSAVSAQQSGRLEAAVTLFGEVIAGRPDFIDALGGRGVALMGLGRTAEALADFDRVLQLSPGHVLALESRGAALAALGQLQPALASYEAVIAVDSERAGAHANRGALLTSLGRAGEALDSLDRAISLSPDNPAFYSARGFALEALGRLEEALESFDKVARLAPGDLEAPFKQSALSLMLERPEAALKAAERALALAPNFPAAVYNRGRALADLHRPQEALAAYEHALALNPNLVDAHNSRGVMLQTLGRPQEALAAYDAALALAKDDPEPNFNKAWTLLSLGEFQDGWRAMEWRKRRATPSGLRDLDRPEWTGAESLRGRTLLVHAEQGLGDSLQFSRYLPLLAGQGARVVFACQDGLCALMRTLGGGVEVIGEHDTLAHYDFHVPIMSLPLALGAEMNTIPSGVPYLSAEPARVARWRQALGDEGFKIGIAWRCSKAGEKLGRAFGLDQFAPIADLPGVRLISLHRAQEGGEALQPPPGVKVETLGPEFDAGPDGFLDTAAVMQSLDLIVTTDTSITHLAGALAAPTWVALMYSPEWRWLRDRQDSPWYPSLRLFRQARPGDWPSVFAAMRLELARKLGQES